MNAPLRIVIPTLHAGQAECFNQRARFNRVRCGRRWGKTELGVAIAGSGAPKGQLIGWFAPQHKYLTEAYRRIHDVLNPVCLSSSKTEGIIVTPNGGRVEFWSLEDERAGRSRKYHKVIIDEGSLAKPSLLKTWEEAIQPTLLDYRGSAWLLGTPLGINEDNFFYRVCMDDDSMRRFEFRDYHAPTRANPLMPADEIEKLRLRTPPLVFKQEYEAEFVDWSGAQFFSLDKLLDDGKPVPLPQYVDSVFAIIDTASKTGTENDGTACVYWALTRNARWPLVAIDWDILQIEGALLETWLPTVFQNLEHYAAQCHAIQGSVGALIEDKNSGTILLQQAARRGWPANAIESDLTAMGKDERGISVSGYVYRGEVKIAEMAYNKTVEYKQATRNHFVSQVMGFKPGDKDAARRADDLYDCFTYGIIVALGDSQGH